VCVCVRVCVCVLGRAYLKRFILCPERNRNTRTRSSAIAEECRDTQC